MKQFNFTKVVVLTIFFAITQMGMMTEAEAHARNTSTTALHACMVNKTGSIRIVPATGKCKKNESVLHWAIAGATGPAGPVSGTGNIVAYVDGSGEHGLEAKTLDESSALNWAQANTAAEAYNSPPLPDICFKDSQLLASAHKDRIGAAI
jgi:hypothetical protein